MRKILIPALLIFASSAFAQISEKPADASATKMNTTRVAVAEKNVAPSEVKAKNVAAPGTGTIDQTVPERQTQNGVPVEEKRVKSQNPSATKP